MTNPPYSHNNPDPAYRYGIGIILFNRQGLVLIAERLDNPGAWQLPQGGIDVNETPAMAVFREMEEEIGTRNATIIHIMAEWIDYEFPAHARHKLFDGKYLGQRQQWIALRFLGADNDIRLDAHSHPEFSRWKWVTIHEVLDHAVPFKRGVYERVIKEFASYAVDAP